MTSENDKERAEIARIRDWAKSMRLPEEQKRLEEYDARVKAEQGHVPDYAIDHPPYRGRWIDDV
jgi:hypothetical protein